MQNGGGIVYELTTTHWREREGKQHHSLSLSLCPTLALSINCLSQLIKKFVVSRRGEREAAFIHFMSGGGSQLRGVAVLLLLQLPATQSSAKATIPSSLLPQLHPTYHSSIFIPYAYTTYSYNSNSLLLTSILHNGYQSYTWKKTNNVHNGITKNKKGQVFQVNFYIAQPKR